MNDTATSPTRPRLERRPDDRVVAGVASGIARHFGIDVTVVRVAFVVAAVLGGFGVLAYLGAWLLLPTPEDERARPDAHSWRFWVGLAFLLSAFATVVARFDLPGSGWVFAILLIGVGVALWRQPVFPSDRSWRPGRRSHGGGADGDGDGGDGGGGRPDPGDGGGGGAGSGPDAGSLPDAAAVPGTSLVPVRARPAGLPVPGPPPSPRPAPPTRAEVRAARPRSWLASATFATALVAAGVAVGLDRADVVDVSAAKTAALAMAILGAGLVVGAFAGRARSLIAPALVLVPVVGFLGTLDHVGLDPFDTVGDRTYRIDGPADPDLRPAYHLGTGELRLDLSRLDPAGSTIAVRADVAIGSLRVWVPEGVEVAVDGEVAAGALEVVDEDHDGRGVHERTVVPGTPGRGRIDLDLEMGFGSVRVETGSPGDLGDVDVPPSVPTTPTVPATPTVPPTPTTPMTPTVPPTPTATTATTVATTATLPEGTR